MRALDSQSEKEPTRDVLDADTTSLYRSTVARLSNWAADRPDNTERSEIVRPVQESMTGRDSNV